MLTATAVDYLLRITISLLPVLFFLLALSLLDSYKLVRGRSLTIAILFGCLAAAASLGVQMVLANAVTFGEMVYQRYWAPFVEELLKSAYIVYLIGTRRVGFMVDAAISGFAVGAGFAIVENTYYVGGLGEKHVAVWIVRGFGTAIMHGGTTALFALLSKNLSDRRESRGVSVYLPGFLTAVVLHSFYNHFWLSPILATVVIHVTLPLVILAVFYRSERATRRWLGSQFDNDQELLDIINSGRVSDTHIGVFFRSIRESFPPETVVDMLCYLRVHVELAVHAKGLLLMREAGFDPKPSPDAERKLAELKHLKKSIGKTGQLAINPLVHTSHRDVFQIYMLGRR
jgi:RsiW-degrading membrane proteinase PrsW (M82 family)